jgi:alkylated DNA repair dioxygenase AlkB
MSGAFQGSLLDLGEDAGPGPLGETVERTVLTEGAWVDVRRGWIDGADVLFERLRAGVPWRAERRPMYERVVDVPRLLCFYDEDDVLPDPALEIDRIGRGAKHDTMVAIVSLGAPRALRLRPRGGGSPSLRFDVGHGDLLVMGGSCQRTWEHCVPKTARDVGPRISVQFRPRGVR